MLPKKNRYIFSGRLPQKSISNEMFFLRYEKASLISKVAIVVSKKVDVRATKRNELKRIFSHILSSELKNRPQHFNLVFYLKPGVKNAQKGEIENSVHEMLGKIV